VWFQIYRGLWPWTPEMMGWGVNFWNSNCRLVWGGIYLPEHNISLFEYPFLARGGGGGEIHNIIFQRNWNSNWWQQLGLSGEFSQERNPWLFTFSVSLACCNNLYPLHPPAKLWLEGSVGSFCHTPVFYKWQAPIPKVTESVIRRESSGISWNQGSSSPTLGFLYHFILTVYCMPDIENGRSPAEGAGTRWQLGIQRRIEQRQNRSLKLFPAKRKAGLFIVMSECPVSWSQRSVGEHEITEAQRA
jgi:hypothetical protein